MADAQVKVNTESLQSGEIDHIGEEIVEDDTINSVHKCLLGINEVLEMILKKLKWRDLLNCGQVCSLWRKHTVEMIEKFNRGVRIHLKVNWNKFHPRLPFPELDRTPTNPIQFFNPEYLSNFRLRFPHENKNNGNDLTLVSILLKLTSETYKEYEIQFESLKLETCKEMLKVTDIDILFKEPTMEMILMPSYWNHEEQENEAVDFNRKVQGKKAGILNHPSEMNITKFLKTPFCFLNGIKLTGNTWTIIPHLPYILREISPRCKIIIKISLDGGGHYESPSAEDLADAHSWNLKNLVLMLQLNEERRQRILDDIANILPNLQTLELCGIRVQQLILFVVQGRRLGQNLRKLTIHGNIYNMYHIFTESNVLPKLQELHIKNGSICCQENQGRSDCRIIFKALINLKYLTHLSLPLILHSKEGWWYEYWLGPDYEAAWPWPYLSNLKLTNGQCCGPPPADLNLLKLKRPNLHLEYGPCVNVNCNV